MSSKIVTITNRLFTAVMLVALLIACQEMPEDNNFGGTDLERLTNQS